LISRHSLLATSFAALVAALVAGAFGYFTLDRATAAGQPAAGVGVLRLGSSYANASGYDRYSYVIVSRDDAAAAASQPGKSLVYHSGTDVNTQWNCGVPYTQALANGWLLKDSSGALLVNSSYTNNYIGDVGNPDYQAAWVNNVASFLTSNGADGVFIDDVLANVGNITGKRYPAKYPSQAAWEDAMVSFVNYVGPALKQRGFYVLVNADAYNSGDGASDTGALVAKFWQRVGPGVSGLMWENWLQNPGDISQLRANGTEWNNNWTGWSNLVTVAQSMGRDFVGLTYGSQTSTQTMRYGRASFLLKWNGVGGAFVYEVAGADPWNTSWTGDIGTPSGPAYAVGTGWRRDYTGGTVVVNPSASATQAFDLGGTYVRPDGSAVTSVSLGATSGMVLTSTSPAPPTTPPPPPAAPASLSAPAISGTVQEGISLSATKGTWSGSPTSYSYQWQRCNAVGSACAAIAGGTGAAYTLVTGDIGSTMRFAVTATNGGGATTAASNATAVVAAAPVVTPPAPTPPPPVVPAPAQAPASLSVPTLTGNAQEGVRLSATRGTWSGSPTSFGFAWQRCNASGTGCAAIAGASGANYVIATGDVGATLRIVVTATNSGGSTAAASSATAVVAAIPPPSPSTSGGNGKKKKPSGYRTLASEGQPLLEWEGRLFTSPRQFRLYVDSRSLSWTRFLDAHPAVVAALGIPAVKWNQRTFYSKASLQLRMERSGVSYAGWAKTHRLAAAQLSGKARVTPSTEQVLARAVVTWDGIGFTTAAGLRSHLRSQGVDWTTFIAVHPAVAKALGLGQPS
jgi:hypothetical protein